MAFLRMLAAVLGISIIGIPAHAEIPLLPSPDDHPVYTVRVSKVLASTSTEELDRFSRDPHLTVREYVARNPNTSMRTLWMMTEAAEAADEKSLLLILAENERNDSHALDSLARLGDPDIAEAIARNGGASFKTLVGLFQCASCCADAGRTCIRDIEENLRKRGFFNVDPEESGYIASLRKESGYIASLRKKYEAAETR